MLSASCLSSQGVDLADSEPGQGGEHKVEQVLANMDHDVLILEDSFLHCFTKNKKYKIPIQNLRKVFLTGPKSKILKPLT